jgi:transcriptional regulator with XRE-family HTH domain
LDLSEWMTRNQVSDQALADEIGLTRGYVSRIRRGLVHPSLGTALALQEVTKGEIALEMFLPHRLRPQAERMTAVTQPKPKPRPKPPGQPRPPAPPPAAARPRAKRASARKPVAKTASKSRASV